jgi:hypothetical protein
MKSIETFKRLIRSIFSNKSQDTNIKTTRKDGTKYQSIKTENTTVCPFYGSKDIGSGSWTPETYRKCYAVFFFGEWHKEIS